MSSYKLLWAVMGPDLSIEGSQRGQTEYATLGDVMACLDQVMGQKALIELVVVDPSDVGLRGVQIRTDGGRSLITLAEMDDKKEKSMRVFRQGEEGDDVEILGSRWDARLVCKDERIIRNVFEEVFDKGDVSAKLLS